MYDTSFGRQTIGTVMHPPIVTISKAASVGAALCLMRRHTVRCLPVVDHAGQLCGVITYSDIRRLRTLRILRLHVPPVREGLQCIAVEEVMTKPPLAAFPETSLHEASEMMVEHKISGLPVVDSVGGIVGMLTEHDVLAALVRQHEWELDLSRKRDQSRYISEPQVATEPSAVAQVQTHFHERAKGVLEAPYIWGPVVELEYQ